MKLFNFISNNRIFPRKLSAILLPLVALSVLLLACSPSTNDSTIKTKVTLSSSSAILNAVKDTKVGTEKKITITKKPAGATGKWSISPKLPDGLALTGDENADTATLGGTPTESSEKKKYTVTFTGSGDFGSASTTIDVYVAKAKVTLSSSSAILNAVKDTKVETITITKKPAGATGTWSISPKLPDGLDLTGKENADTATLEGTPTETSEEKEYTVTFTGSGDFGSASTTIDVQVAKVGVSLTPPAKLSATKDARITPTSAITKSPTGATGKFSAILPAGLTIDGDTGVIKGTPEGTSTNTYDITFKGSGDYGNAQTTIEIEVGVLEVTLTQPAKLLATKDTEINPGTSIKKSPTVATGEFSVVEKTLPAGLEIDKTTGAIKGTPKAVSSSQTYKIKFTGNGSYGDATTSIEIEVGVLEVTLTRPAKLTATKDALINPTSDIVKNPTEATGEFSATLPDGLSMNGDTGVITGIPTTKSASQPYPITFTGSGSYGNSKTAIDIEVTTLPILSLSLDTPSPITMAKDFDKTITITLKRTPPGAPVPGTWSIANASTLHNGLTFAGAKDSATATITGTPDTISASRSYTVTFTPTTLADYANTAALTIDVSIEVVDSAVTIDAFSLKLLASDGLPADTKITTTPVGAKGVFSGTLPGGLTLNGDGTITGTPTPSVTKDSGDGNTEDKYTVTFTGSDGFGNANKEITVLIYKYKPVDKTALITAIEAEMATAVQGASADLNLIDTSEITDMSDLFYDTDNAGVDRKTFAGDVSKWDVSKVTTMGSLFRGSSFNSNISGWDVSAVTDMVGVFSDTPFNQDISGWDVSAVTSMSAMFQAATSFNQNLNLWTDKIGNVSTMVTMFWNATNFSNKGVKMTWNVTGKNTLLMFDGTAINNNHKPTGL